MPPARGRRTCLAFLLALVVVCLMMASLRSRLVSSSSTLLRTGQGHLVSSRTAAGVQAATQAGVAAAAAVGAARGAGGAADADLPPTINRRPFSSDQKLAAPAPAPAQAPEPQPPKEATKMSVKDTVEKHIKDSHVVVFSKSYCPYCKATKQLLNQLNANPTIFELDQLEEGADWQAYLADKSGQRTVPSVWIDGEFIGGNSDVQNAHGSGKLVKLINKESDLLPSIHHETQPAGSMLCAQHALNNLLQQTYFSPQDLASIGAELDRKEAEVVGGDLEGRAEGEGNYDDTGYFSLGVMQEALSMFGLALVHWSSEDVKPYREHPELLEGFVMNHQAHWYTIRRFGTPERFYNLDSCIPQPSWISSTFLGMTLRAAEQQGYTIFACVPTTAQGLPPCDAETVAQHLPAPRGASSSSSSSSAVASSSKLHLSGRRTMISEAASTYSTNGKGKRRTVQDSDEDDSDDDIIIVDNDQGRNGGQISSNESSATSNVGRTRKKRRGGPSAADDAGVLSNGEASASTGTGEGEVSEEDQMAMAIAESLRASKISSGSTAASSTSNTEGASNPEDELQRALKASLLDDVEVDEEDFEQDDTPSMDELRRRRMQRFGA